MLDIFHRPNYVEQTLYTFWFWFRAFQPNLFISFDKSCIYICSFVTNNKATDLLKFSQGYLLRCEECSEMGVIRGAGRAWYNQHRNKAYSSCLFHCPQVQSQTRRHTHSTLACSHNSRVKLENLVSCQTSHLNSWFKEGKLSTDLTAKSHISIDLYFWKRVKSRTRHDYVNSCAGWTW